MEVQNNSFLSGVLIFLIYDKMFYFLIASNEVLLLKINTNVQLYVIGFYISAILAVIVFFMLYRYLILKNRINTKKVGVLLITFFMIILVNFGANKYVSHLAVNLQNQEVFDKIVTNSAKIDLVFFISCFVILLFFFILRIIYPARFITGNFENK